MRAPQGHTVTFYYLVSVTAGGPVSPEGTCSQFLPSTSVDSKRLESIKKLIEIVILWVYYTIPFGFSFFRHFLVITFQFLNYTFGSETLTRVHFPKCAYDSYREFNQIKNGVHVYI